MKKIGLTEKKMANKKFKKNEQAILIAYYKFRDYPIAKYIARQAKVSRSTLYRHHTNANKIPRDYEEFLLKVYTKRINRITKNQTNLRLLFLRTLVFISMNASGLRLLFRTGHKDIINRMLSCFKYLILEEWNLAGDLEKLYKVYASEIMGVIEIWSEHGFSGRYLNTTLDDIMFITKTSPRRLANLID